MELNFSFKKQKEEKVDKYPDLPVLTYIGSSDGKTKKWQINQKAAELLNYSNSQITGKMISYGPLNELLFIANTTGVETQNDAKINLDNSFSNSKFADRIIKEYGVELYNGREFLLKVPDVKADYAYLIILNDSYPGSLTRDDFAEFPDNAFTKEDEVDEPKVYVEYGEL